MKTSIRAKLEGLGERLAEVSGLLAEPSVIGDQERFRALSKEYAELSPVVESFRQYQQAEDDIASAREMLRDTDAEMREMASWMSRSVSGSTLDVASARISKLGSDAKALAKYKSCLWPDERVQPLSPSS